ncbi:MAG: S8 family serine peptidase [Actinomycetota bacterium]|nr:S8 family serine peptidase [Actinomycetota bacterium]
MSAATPTVALRHVSSAPAHARPSQAAPKATYADDHVLVRLRRGVPAAAADRLLSQFGARPQTAALRGSSWLRVPAGGSRLGALVQRLRQQDAVAEVERDVVRRASDRPDDRAYLPGITVSDGSSARQYDDLRIVRAEEAWDLTTGSSSVVVAVLDSGVRTSHRELRYKVVPGYDVVAGDRVPEDRVGHGTAVAGIVAADTDNGAAIAGVGRDTRIMPVKVLGNDGSGSDFYVARGIRWAVDHGAHVINMSLGGAGSTSVLAEAVAYARAHDVVVVAAAGNSGAAAYEYPASYPGVISVGATDDRGRLTSFSTYNDRVTLAAPGQDMVSLWQGDDQSVAFPHAGTSFAAPVVAGAAALVRARFPEDSAEQVRERLVSTARDAGPRGLDTAYGYGVVDVAAALGAPRASALPETPPTWTDAPDVPARAVPLRASSSHDISRSDDIDWFYADVSAGKQLEVTVTPRSRGRAQGLDAVLAVYDSGLRRLRFRDYRALDEAERLRVVVPRTGRYYVSVRNANASSGPSVRYSLTRAVVRATTTAARAGTQLWFASLAPLPAATSVSRRTSVTVRSARPLDPASVTSRSFALLDGVTGRRVSATVRYDATSRRATLVPAQTLRRSTPYVVRVGRGLRDTRGTALTRSTQWSFTTAAPGGLRFAPVPARRVLDTRTGLGVRAGAVGGGGYVDLDVTDTAGVPSTAKAVVLNVTGVTPTGPSVVAVSPTPSSGTSSPATSDLHLRTGETAANQVTVAVGSGGRVRFTVSGKSVHLLAHVAGYYATRAAAGFTPVAATRVLDTRAGIGVPAARLGPGGSVDLTVPGAAGVPSYASAVVLNLTAVTPTSATDLRLFPAPLTGSAPPALAQLHVGAADTRASLVTVPLGRDGAVRVHNSAGTVDLLADVVGYYAVDGATGLVPVRPVRVMDTRSGMGAPARRVSPGSTLDLALGTRADAPARAQAALLTVTALDPSTAGSLRAWPAPAGDGPRPTTTTVEVAAAVTRGNATVVGIGARGAVRLSPSGTDMDVVTDLSGWFVR